MSLATLLAVLTVYSFHSETVKRAHYECLQYLPAAYEQDAARRWPLLVFLHGAGERGTDPWLVAKHGPPKLLREGATLTPAEKTAAGVLAENFIVIAPQCPPGAVWDDEAVLALIDDAVRRLRVDPARIYLSGLSMGGYGTWSLLGRAPERFAAAVPICGGGRLIEFLIASDRQKAALRTLGVWAFHGAKDPSVPLVESERMIAAAKRAGVTDVQLTVYPDAQHDSWTETFANPELYAWLLRHKR